MTRINKIVMTGFKSFAKRIEMPFTDSYNVILGPNGSGKSNVLDALCFVLGRTSSKSMRAEKLSHLIYNGGKTKEPANKAEVSIYFDNTSKLFQKPEPEIRITRTVKQSGQSVYRINDERCTRQQVIDLMSLANIDPEGYNIILQGDIIRFVEMTPEERRQIIEEVAGISIYEDRKQKALNELQRVEERLKEADILLSERKAHLKELKEDRDQAIKYKDLNDKINQSKSTLLNLQINKLESQKNAIDKDSEAQKKQITLMQESISTLKSQAEERKKQIALLNEQIEEKGEKEQVKLHKAVEEMKVLIATNCNKAEYCALEAKKQEEKKKQFELEISDFEKKTKILIESKAQFEKDSSEKRKELLLLEKNIEKFRKSHKIENLSEMESELEKIDKESEEKQNELQKLVEQKQNLLREKDKLEIQIQNIDERTAKVMEVEKGSKEELTGLKKLKEDFKRLILELNQAISNDSGFAAQISEIKKKLTSAEENLTRLRMRGISIKERAQGSLAVRKLLEQKSINGIFGTISELGTAKSSYSVALEVSAGPRLNSLVVENEKVASDCIEYLKKNRFGVATFLPLNKIRQKEEENKKIKRLLEIKGVNGLAIDLVSYEPKYKKAFGYVFGNTIVVENLNVARRIGIGNARMVTLDGDLCELSGVMQGGFRQKLSSFREDELKNELEAAEKGVKENSELLEAAEKKRAQNEALISDLRKRKAELEAEITKSEKLLHLEADDFEASKNQKRLFEASLKAVEKELKELQEKFNISNKQILEIKTRRQRLREQIGGLRSPTLIAEINAFEQKRSETKTELFRIENELKNLETQSGLFNNEIKKIQSLVKQIEKEKELLSAERLQLIEKIEKDKAELKQLEEKASKFYLNFKQLFNQRNRLAEEVQKFEEDIIRKEEQIRASEIRTNNIALRLTELGTELVSLKREFEKYSDVKLLEEKEEAKLKAEINRFEGMAIEMGNVNLKALEIYDEVEKQYNSLSEKREKLSEEKDSVLSMINEINSKKKDLFMNTFNATNESFGKIFQSLSAKGEAHIFLEDEEKPFEGGIRIRVKIIGNKFLDIRSLSGGEKTLTALAFIFAIQEHNPASFYVLDEVDAALDKRNSEKLSDLIKKYSEKAQYIVISHNDVIVSEANTLYGVSMDEHGISNVVGLKV